MSRYRNIECASTNNDIWLPHRRRFFIALSHCTDSLPCALDDADNPPSTFVPRASTYSFCVNQEQVHKCGRICACGRRFRSCSAVIWNPLCILAKTVKLFASHNRIDSRIMFTVSFDQRFAQCVEFLCPCLRERRSKLFKRVCA